MNSAIDISNVVLKTERLIIRPWKLSDLNDFYDYCKVDGVGQWAGWYPHKNKEESLVILNSFINNKNTFCLEYEGKAIGSIGIEKYNEELYDEFSALHGRELGFVLSNFFLSTVSRIRLRNLMLFGVISTNSSSSMKSR